MFFWIALERLTKNKVGYEMQVSFNSSMSFFWTLSLFAIVVGIIKRSRGTVLVVLVSSLVVMSMPTPAPAAIEDRDSPSQRFEKDPSSDRGDNMGASHTDEAAASSLPSSSCPAPAAPVDDMNVARMMDERTEFVNIAPPLAARQAMNEFHKPDFVPPDPYLRPRR